MNILGLTITRTKAAIPRDLRMPESRNGWHPIIREGFSGAWQQNVETPLADVLSHPTVFACLRTISGDIAKMRRQLVQEIGNDVWIPVENPAFSPVIRRPNHYQTPFQFVQTWLLSKLTSGNTYVLLQRDARQVVVAQYVLDPWRVQPLVSPDGSVFYELKADPLGRVPENPGASVVVPASEIMHDRMNPLFHPLVGISPLYAAGIPAILGLKIVTNSAHFFENGATPGGFVTVPGSISEADALAMKDKWETAFTGVNAGRIAIMADGMKYEPVATMTSDKAQTSEQWGAASQAIADAFGVPWYLVGGPQPPYNNIQALNVQYYTQCIQPLTTAFEEVSDYGYGLAPDRINGVRYGIEFNRNDLLLMDTQTQIAAIAAGVGAGVMAPNEGRAQLNLPPVDGGEEPVLQQQNWPLSVLKNRPPPTVAAAPQTQTSRRLPAAEMDPDDEEMMQAASLALLPANSLRAKLGLAAV